MQLTYLTEGADGMSRFSDYEIDMVMGDFAPPAPAMYLSEAEPAQRMLFLVLPAGWTGELHPSPHRQMVIGMSGRMQFWTGDGQSREVGPGDVVRCDDTKGTGHRSAVLGHESARLMIVQF